MTELSMAVLMSLLTAGAGNGEAVPQDTADYGVYEMPGFRCVIGNNAEMGKHRGRYNGVFQIVANGMNESPFVEDYAGLNLEHYFDCRPRPKDNDVLFEPRVAPMSYRRTGPATAELHQPPTPVYKVESWTTFALKAPHYIDMTFRCVPTEDVFEGGFFGVFWASYINAPLDKSLYFLRAGSTLDEPLWEQFSTQTHGVHSSLLQENDTFAPVFQEPNDLLFASEALFRYSVPFYYGRFRDQVLIYIFKPGPIVRLTQSPSGGGTSEGRTSNNPAWDFQLIVPDYKVGQEYGLEMRLVYKPWTGRDDVLEEVRKYLGEGVEGASAR